MFLYLVRPESSRILCCKVYKRIGVVFRWFFPGVFCESVVFTEVRRRSRSVGGGRVYSGVTRVTSLRGYVCLAEAVSDGRSSVFTSLVELVVKSCVELLRSCGINILVVFSDIPVF